MENKKSKGAAFADAILSRHNYNAEARRFIDALGHSVPADGEQREAARQHLASLATELSDEACELILYRLEGAERPKWASAERNEELSPYIYARGNPFWCNIKEMLMQKQRSKGQILSASFSCEVDAGKLRSLYEALVELFRSDFTFEIMLDIVTYADYNRLRSLDYGGVKNETTGGAKKFFSEFAAYCVIDKAKRKEWRGRMHNGSLSKGDYPKGQTWEKRLKAARVVIGGKGVTR